MRFEFMILFYFYFARPHTNKSNYKVGYVLFSYTTHHVTNGPSNCFKVFHFEF